MQVLLPLLMWLCLLGYRRIGRRQSGFGCAMGIIQANSVRRLSRVMDAPEHDDVPAAPAFISGHRV
jgi:hypothetical protein